MGNNASHGIASAGRGGGGIFDAGPQHQWAHSFPRDLQRAPHLKVLPELNGGTRLRTTDNGAILSSEGTIRGAGRRHDDGRRDDGGPYPGNGVHRSRSVHGTRDAFIDDADPRALLHRSRTNMYPRDRRDIEMTTFAAQAKRFGSEPDLRVAHPNQARNHMGNSGPSEGFGAKNRISRGRKKYKAPAPPPGVMVNENSSPESYHWELTSGGDTSDTAVPKPRLRLFKTRAETHKANGLIPHVATKERKENFHQQYRDRQSSRPNQDVVDKSRTEPRNIRDPNDRYEKFSRNLDKMKDKGEGGVMIRGRERAVEVRTKANRSSAPPVMSRSLSSPEFQAELRAVTQKLRVMDRRRIPEQHDEVNGMIPIENSEDVNIRNDNYRMRDDAEEIKEYNKKKSKESKMITMDHHNISIKQQLINGYKETIEKKRTEQVDNRKGYKSSRELSQEKHIEEDRRSSKYSREDSQERTLENRISERYSDKSSHERDGNSSRKSSKYSRESSQERIIDEKKINKQNREIVQNKKSEKIVQDNRYSTNYTREHSVEKSDNRKISKYSRESSESQNTDQDASRGQASGKESTPDQSPNRKPERDEFKTPAKTFYFGMDASDMSQKPVNDHVKSGYEKHNLEHQRLVKAANLEVLPGYQLPRQSSSESALSSEIECDDDNLTNGHDISMNLRPTLPKKQLEIPRFSPSTAWRMLSAADTAHPQNTSTVDSEEGQVLTEDRIERLSRPIPVEQLLGQRSSHDKSGDSGISGDAGPALIEDVHEPPAPLPPPSKTQPNNMRPLVAWTPQQDLEEEASSSDGGLDLQKSTNISCNIADVKFNARSHVFSLSLPRESHLTMYNGSDKSQRSPPTFNSLQKLRRSIGAALGSRGRINEDSAPEGDGNWFLSTSAPTSLNNNTSNVYRLSRGNSDEEERSPSLEDKEPHKTTTMLKTPSFTYLANGGHVMYLPTMERRNGQIQKKSLDDEIIYRNKKKNEEQKNRYNRDERLLKGKSIDMPLRRKEFGPGLRNIPFSKSCENITEEMRQINRTPSPDLKNALKDLKAESDDKKNIKGKGKRFTFQSTVRQIERKRIAEKLSKEAEKKERQRLSELEAMRRVEEEFQRKRAREKASIRQQLRLFSMDDNNVTNSQNSWEESQFRQDPDGAVSSPAPSPTHNGQNLTQQFSKQSLKPKDNTPYVNKIIEQKMSQPNRVQERNAKNGSEISSRGSQHSQNSSSRNYEPNRRSTDAVKRYHKKDHRSSPISRSSDDGRLKAPATEVLSEYRQPTREYRDYRGLPRFTLESTIEYQTTVHPQVVYNMPKASQKPSHHEVVVSDGSPRSIDNYRREFAHGTAPTSSDSELSCTRSPLRLRARSTSLDSNRSREHNSKTDDEDDNNEDSEKMVVRRRRRCNSEGSAGEKSLVSEESTEQQMKDDSASPSLPKVTLGNLQPQPFMPGKSYRPISFKVNT